MAKSLKKKRPVTRDPLISRAQKTLRTGKALKTSKTLKTSKALKTKKRGKPARSVVAAQHVAPDNARLPPPLALGPGAAVMDRLWSVVMNRRTADPAVSHSARLLSRGPAKVAQKFGEEAVECLIEAVAGNRDALVAESADVLYHLIVLWVSAGVSPHEVWDELKRREGISGVAEKAARVKSLPVAFGLETTKIP
jgi:phosphoribosyl-ATP pyrophosphohydrolase